MRIADQIVLNAKRFYSWKVEWEIVAVMDCVIILELIRRNPKKLLIIKNSHGAANIATTIQRILLTHYLLCSQAICLVIHAFTDFDVNLLWMNTIQLEDQGPPQG